jgi:hypothetical protein
MSLTILGAITLLAVGLLPRWTPNAAGCSLIG